MSRRLNTDTLASVVLQAMQDIVAIVDAGMERDRRHASGRTKRETRAVVKVEGDTIHGQVLTTPYFKYIEAGSGPGKRGTWFFHVIHKWARHKHIISGDTPADRRISGAIAHSIEQHGTKAWQEGGQDVFTSEVDARLDRLKEATQSAVSREIINLIHLDLNG